MTSLQRAHVIVTGGSEGIGLAIAKQAIDRGAKVSIIARRRAPLEFAARWLGPSADWAAADVGDRENLTRAVAQLVEANGPCDVMVANAGYSRPGRFWELPADEFEQEMRVNYLGSVNAAATVLPAMRERRRGHLCFVSSTAGLLGVYGFTAYSPTKFAVRGFAESLRSEVAPDGIKVSVVYPPDTDTPGFEHENLTKPAETHAVSGSIKPVSPERVARAAIDGIERDHFTITADATTAALSRMAGLLGPLARRFMDYQVHREQRSGHGSDPHPVDVPR